MTQPLSVAKVTVGFATVLLFAIGGGFIGYGIGACFNGTLSTTFSFAGVMSGLVVGAIYFARKVCGHNSLAVEESIRVWDDQLFDGDHVLTYDNATDRYIWMPRTEWDKTVANAEEGGDSEDEEDDDDSVKT